MLQLTNASKPIDLITLKEELQRANELESVGGAGLSGKPQPMACLAPSNIDHYGPNRKEKSTLRRLIQMANETMARSYQDEESAEEILHHTEKAIFDIAGQQFRTGFSSIAPVVSDVFKEIEELSTEKTPVTGLETGYVDLDRNDRRHACFGSHNCGCPPRIGQNQPLPQYR